jgi:hypothetical protein
VLEGSGLLLIAIGVVLDRGRVVHTPDPADGWHLDGNVFGACTSACSRS